ncbi:30S ribosomal protein S15 [Candidatus Micrarchaeota archaeon]|nr:30S ribosomal protein S15 [Candidatus Micrarchaeota archaeon]
MARMHARKKGKSGSTRPSVRIKPEWIQYSKEETSELVVKLFKEGKTISEIGGLLRDQYGIPSVKTLTGKSISKILSAEKLLPKWPEDLMNLFKKAVRLKRHLDVNKADKINARQLRLAESKIKRLVSYYKTTKRIPQDWHYKPEEAALLIKE